MGNLNVTQINGQDAQAGKAKTFVHYDQGTSPTIKASYNVSSVADNGTGDFTVNITNTFISPDEFQPKGMAGDRASLGSNAWTFLLVNDYNTVPTASACRFNIRDVGGAMVDMRRNYVSAFGEQA